MHIRKKVRGGYATLSDQLLPFAVGALLILIVVSAILALRPGGDGTVVLVAKSDLEAGRTIDPNDAKLVSVPESAIPEGALTRPSELTELAASRPIQRGTVLTRTDLVTKADLLPAGKASIQLELETGIQGITGGDTVQVWGPPNACTEADGGMELLDGTAQVQAVSAEDATLLSGESASVVLLSVSQTAVPEVLCAASSGVIHLVRAAG